ncbi:MAG: sugar transferase [Oscillospiraceae bacterium]|nr:sugar transferase [Oscillospiraceae bacterium]
MNTTQIRIDGSSALKSGEYESANFTITLHEKNIANPYSRTYLFLKRAIDISVSFLGLILLSPVFLLLAAAIRADSKGKVVYTQKRIGKNGKTFKIYKFRTMVHNADEVWENFTPEQKAEFEVNFKLENDPRITRTGEFLRKTSLDELPQLVNILLGDISIVGPRPIVEREVYKYGVSAWKLMSVKPGLTGYWQVSGRNDVTYDERVEMDMFYIDNMSLLTDTKIFFKTFKVVLDKKGAH